MAALAGYNPNMSLLPSAGGQIQAMSGGGAVMSLPPPGYNPHESMLQVPPSGGVVKPYTGGFNQTGFIGGDTPAGYSELAGNTVAASSATGLPLSLSVVPSAESKPATSSASTNAVANPPPAVASAQQKPANASKNSENVSTVVIFGETLKLENPKTMKTDVLTEEQKKALTLFGLDGPGISDVQKKDVIQALYDGKCNSDKPLIMLQNCEPIRRIVQSLALNLLGMLEPVSDKGGLPSVKKEDQPVVEFKKADDGSMAVTLTFKPGQLHLLSKFTAKKPANDIKVPAPTAAEPEKKKKGLFGLFGKKTEEPKAENPPFYTSANLKGPVGAAAVPEASTATGTAVKESPASADDTATATAAPKTEGGYDLVTTRGIVNPNMWCYAVSSIQLLFSIPQFREALLKYICDPKFVLPATDGDIDILTKDKITDDGVLCALRIAFGELNKSTTQFTKTNWESDMKRMGPLEGPKKTIKEKGKDVVKETGAPSIAYLMKAYLYNRRPSQLAINKNQQDVDEFIKYLLEVVGKNTQLKSSLDALSWKRETSFTCENTEFKKENRVDEENELFVQLDVTAFASETNISYKNKLDKVKKTKTVSLQDLINYFSKPTVLKDDNEIEGCGPDGGKGPGTKKDIIVPDATNDFLVFQINKGANPVQASTISNQYSINAEPSVTVNGYTYNIYGAILYGGSGTSGHYMYERLYYPPPQTKTTIDGIPFIMYNSGIVTANNNQSYTIQQNAYYILYQRVGGTPKAPAATDVAPKEEEEEEGTGQMLTLAQPGNLEEGLLGAEHPSAAREAATENEEENEKNKALRSYSPPSATNVGLSETSEGNKENALAAAAKAKARTNLQESLLGEREENEEENVEVKEAREKLKEGVTTQKEFNTWLQRRKENKSQPLSASAPILSQVEATANAGKKRKGVSFRNQQPGQSLTNVKIIPARGNQQNVENNGHKAGLPTSESNSNYAKAQADKAAAALTAKNPSASTAKQGGGKIKAETLKRKEALTKRKLKGGRKTFKKANLKKVRTSRKKTKST